MKQLYIFLICVTVFYKTINAFESNEPIFNRYYEEINKNTYNISANCTKPGLMCSDCTHVVNCIQTEPGKFIPITVQVCAGADKKEYCLENTCSTAPNSNCGTQESIPFTCYNTGIFPNPRNCHLYHVCIQNSDIEKADGEDQKFQQFTVKCEDDYGYNPVTTYCDKKLTNKLCPLTPPVPGCKNIGQMGSIPSTSIFYICVIDTNGNLYPELHMCPHGTKLNNSGVCV